MFAHAGQLCEGSDDGTLATPRRGRWEFCGVDMRPPSDSEHSKQKSPRRISPRRLFNFRDDVLLPVICPTCQTIFEPSTNCGKFNRAVSKMQTALADHLSKNEKPAASFAVRALRCRR
jgi:hypothetical protein